MPFSLMDNIISMKRDGVDYYYLTDAMGSIYQVVDANGNLVNSYDYNSWGEIREQNETVTNPFLWQTKPWDEEVTLYYSRARYYEGKTGRFLGVDPANEVYLGNRYVFGLAAPVFFVDPDGEAVMPGIIIIGGGAIIFGLGTPMVLGLFAPPYCPAWAKKMSDHCLQLAEQAACDWQNEQDVRGHNPLPSAVEWRKQNFYKKCMDQALQADIINSNKGIFISRWGNWWGFRRRHGAKLPFER